MYNGVIQVVGGEGEGVFVVSAVRIIDYGEVVPAMDTGIKIYPDPPRVRHIYWIISLGGQSVAKCHPGVHVE